VAAAEGGGISQTFVHSWSEWETFVEHNKPDKNLYCNIARMRQDMRPVVATFPFDFDSPMKESAFEENVPDGEKINRMRQDSDLAYEVLGDVWDDTQSLIRGCREENVPVITVFSGLGVHAHLLYEEQVNPTEQKVTTSKHFVEKCDLSTWDRKILPDTKRILRIPNSQRIDERGPAGAWCIPMTEDEVLNNSLLDMLERCSEPKTLPEYSRYEVGNRPRMQVYDDVDVDEDSVGTVELQKRDISEVPDNVEYIIDSCIPLPCVSERFIGPNPDHLIRFSGVVFLYQSGFTPEEVRDIIREIGWVDYDEKITRKMTKQIWNRQYSELSCSKLQSLGLCVMGPNFEEFGDEPSDCETYRYTSGEALYPYDK
jgi:hypothetical protein